MNKFCFTLLSITAVLLVFSLSACKKYPEDIKVLCDSICKDGCHDSCEIDPDFASYEKGSCERACRVGCWLTCESSVYDVVPDYDPKIIEGPYKEACETQCKSDCQTNCEQEIDTPADVPVCTHTCIPVCIFGCVKENLNQ